MEDLRRGAPLHRPAERIGGSERDVPTGMIACAACGVTVDTSTTYTASEGEICGVCHAEREADDILHRGDRERAMSTLLAPAWVGLGLMAVVPLLGLFGPTVEAWLAIVPALCSLIGAQAIHRGLTGHEIQRGNRAFLVGAGAVTMLVLLGLAVSMSGVLR